MYSCGFLILTDGLTTAASLACASPRGGKRLVADAVATARRVLHPGAAVLVRMDAAFYGCNPVRAARAGGAAVSVTTRMDQRVKAAIASIARDA
jgi:hypothetical protein